MLIILTTPKMISNTPITSKIIFGTSIFPIIHNIPITIPVIASPILIRLLGPFSSRALVIFAIHIIIISSPIINDNDSAIIVGLNNIITPITIDIIPDIRLIADFISSLIYLITDITPYEIKIIPSRIDDIFITLPDQNNKHKPKPNKSKDNNISLNFFLIKYL